MARNYKPLAEAIEYFEEIGPVLYELEQKIKEIKHSPEFIKYKNTMGVYSNRGIIEEQPSFKNKYSVPQELYIKKHTQKTEDFLKKVLAKTE